MKRKALLDKLSIAKTCLATQDTIPVLTHFYFDKNKIMSFNTGQAAIIEFPSNLSGCVPGEQLFKLLGSYSTDEVSISQGTDSISVKSARSSVNLKTLPMETFPFKLADDVLTTGVVHELTSEFFEGVRACALSMGNNASQRNQYGITVISNSEKTVIYSSDKARISAFTLSKPLESAPFSILLPKPFCDNLISVSRDFNSSKLYVGKDFILVDFLVEGKSSGIQLYSNFNDDIELLPFENIFSQVAISNDKFQSIPESLLSCVDRNLILISSDKNPEIEIKTEGKVMTVSSGNDHGDVSDEIEFSNDMDSLVFTIKPLFVRQALVASEKIAFSDFDGDPVLVGMKDNFLHLVSSIAK